MSLDAAPGTSVGKVNHSNNKKNQECGGVRENRGKGVGQSHSQSPLNVELHLWPLRSHQWQLGYELQGEFAAARRRVKTPSVWYP